MSNMFDLTGKKALVVGGAGDLGKGMLRGLLEAGAEAVVIDMNDRPHVLATSLCAEGYWVQGVSCDVTDREQIKASFEKALELLRGRIDILLNTAGIQRRHKCEEFPLSEWDLVLEINLTALFQYCQLVGKHMIENGIHGKIINVASMLSFFGGYTVPAYAASKGGVAQLTKALSNEWMSYGINVNAIAPGYMDTALNVNLVNDPKRTVEIMERIPAKRWGNGQDLKGTIIYLASDASNYVSGAVIPVDGGYLGR